MPLSKPTPSLASRLIVALDVPTVAEALHLVETLKPLGVTFKVGMQLFYQGGMSVVHQIQAEGGPVFLDLKLHDIPNTVSKASETLVSQGVSFFNVHTQGGIDMMQAASQTAEETAQRLGRPKPLVIGVTVLTSLTPQVLEETLKICERTEDYVVHLAGLAKDSGLQGVVCSAQEVPRLRQTYGPEFVLITPGIRPAGSDVNDQARIQTPGEALKAGAHYLVVGRPITQASQPRIAAEAILEEMAQATTPIA